MQQAKATIYLAEERGINETSSFRSLFTFNYGNFFNAYKIPFNDLYVVNDDTLDGGRSLSITAKEFSYTILLPVVGAIRYKDSFGNENLIAAGQVQLFNIAKEATIEISNPFKAHLVNFIQVWIKAASLPTTPIPIINTYNVNEQINRLITISTDYIHAPTPFIISIGKFNGRGETVYPLQHNSKGVFVFVLEGAFEVEGRLLHARDGLALWNTTEAAIESLSNDAILLLIETLHT